MRLLLLLLLIPLHTIACEKDAGFDEEFKAESAAKLISLAQKHHIDLREFVLKRYDNQLTLLHLADDLKTAQFCLDHGEDVHATYRKSGDDQIPLQGAIDGAFEKIKFDTLAPMVQFLCNKGSHLFSRHNLSIFAWMYSIKRISHPGIDILLKALEDKSKKHKLP